MKHFFKKIFTFFSVAILFSIILSVTVTSFLSESSYYKIDPTITDIYVGDSHMQYAVVDSLLINSQNIATSSESFYFSYYRLKKIFESENNIETVYLGFSYHSLSDYYNAFIYGKYSPSISPKYFYLLPFSEQKKMLYYNRKKLHNYLISLIKNAYRPILSNTKFGGYSNHFTSTKSRKSSMDKRINFQYYRDEKMNGFSQINLLYLEKIINLSVRYKFNLTIINTPLDSYYKRKIPIEYIDKYDDIINKYNLNLIDFDNLTLDESCYIPDGDHLSEIGAIKMTMELIKVRTHNNVYKKLPK